MRRQTSLGGIKAKPKLPEKWAQLRLGAFGPNYTLDEVKHFYSCFSFVDSDMSGEIDVDEWQHFLHGMDQDMTPTDSRRLFMHIDANHNGAIDMAEICHVVFNRATPAQRGIMINVMKHANATKKKKSANKRAFTRGDLRQLFKLYDENDEKRLPLSRLKAAFTILSVSPAIVEKLFGDAGIDPVIGDVDADEFTDIFHAYLKNVMVSPV